MKTKTTATAPELPEPTEPEIQKLAYRLWVEGGRRDGVETDNWFAAQELLRHHHGRVHPVKQPLTAAPAAAVPAFVVSN